MCEQESYSPTDFSLVNGGPAYHLLLRLGLAGREKSRVGRRTFALVSIAVLAIAAIVYGDLGPGALAPREILLLVAAAGAFATVEALEAA